MSNKKPEKHDDNIGELGPIFDAMRKAEKDDYPRRERRRNLFIFSVFMKRIGCFILWIIIILITLLVLREVFYG